MRSVPVSRYFIPVPDAYQREDGGFEEMLSSIPSMGRITWESLLQEHRVVILADAGAGKTHELRATAERLAVKGRPAFFIRIEDIDEDFAAAFEVGTEEVFNAWLDGIDEAWFFLDSVDEVRLASPRAFEDALRRFGARIRNALQRARVFISSRPYAWRASLDRAVLNQALPFGLSRRADEEQSASPVSVAETSRHRAQADDNESARQSLKLYLLAPLEAADIRQFAQAGGVADIDDFLGEVERRALFPLARQPFDLIDLVASWLADGELASRLSILRGSVRRQLAGPAAADRRRTLAAAQTLAMAATLIGVPNIRLPGAGTPQAIDPEAILLELDKDELNSLLQRGVFADPIFGEVRFRHREVRELLAAEWIAKQLRRPKARPQINALMFRNSYGEEIIAPRFRPLLPWLILFDADVLQRVMSLNPEIAVEGGDATQLPLGTRMTLLDDIVRRTVDPDSPLRGIDNAAVARIAQPDLDERAAELLASHGANDDAVFLLGRLVWQGRLARCVDPLARIAADASRGLYARLVSIRAVTTVGSTSQASALWHELNTRGTPIPRRLLAEFADNAAADATSTGFLLASLDRLEPRREFEPSGLTQALNGFVDRLPPQPDPEGPTSTLVAGLQGMLAREPHVERGECRVSEEHQWLMSPALHAVGKLILERSSAALSSSSLAILAAVPALRFWRGDDLPERRAAVDALVPAWPELNDALFWWTVAEHGRAGERPLSDDCAISWPGHLWAFDGASFERTLSWISTREDQNDRLVALARAFRTFDEEGRPPQSLTQLRDAVAGKPALKAVLEAKLDPPRSAATREFEREERQYRREREQREAQQASDRAGFVSQVVADPTLVGRQPGHRPGTLNEVQYHLLRMAEGEGLRDSSGQGSDWRALIPEFGREVAEAYRDAAKAHWRGLKPALRSEGADTSSIPYSLIFAMAGLDMEIGGDPQSMLSASDARRAFRYAPWELNGFPRWFEALYRARPTIGRAFVWRELEWELGAAGPDVDMHYVLSDIVYHAPWLQSEMAPLLLEWLRTNDSRSEASLHHVRTILVGGGTSPAELAALARMKVAAPGTPAGELPSWYSLWVDVEPAPAIAALRTLLDSGAVGAPTPFVMSFVVGLLGGRRQSGPAIGKFRTPTHLKDLYVLTHRAILVGDDIERAGKGVYSPTLRDDAQDARERLFGMLNEIPGELSYLALVELAERHPEPSYRAYMRSRAHQHAMIDGDVPAWTQEQVVSYARRLMALPIDSEPTDGGDAAD